MPAYVSPGVYVIEKDWSDYSPSLNSTSVGVIGFASTGPVGKATLCTNADQLIQTVGEYNQKIEQSMESGAESPSQLTGKRWVLLGPAKAHFTTTEGGAAISERFEVLDENRQPIEGLYAVGQNGLGGQILFGHGLHIAWAMTSGRLLGAVLADDSRRIEKT